MGAEEGKEKGLSYFISEKPPFAVVIFIGEMTKATLEVLDECQKDLSSRADTQYVVVFRDVTSVDLNALGPLTRFQKLLRDKGAVRVCSLRPEIKKLGLSGFPPPFLGSARDGAACPALSLPA
jgi:anti-anti-sigma regulatory factor